MAKKKNKIHKLPRHLVDTSNAYRCNLCGKIVAGLHLNRHLLVAHKLDCLSVKDKFTDLGRKFQHNPNAKAEALLRQYERNRLRPAPEFSCGSHPAEPKPIKIIYTPMGNKR